MIFAAAIIPVVGIVGSAVDFATAFSERTKMQAALDAAVIVAAKEYAATRNENGAVAKAREQYLAAAQQTTKGDITAHSVTGNKISLTASAQVPTSFMAVMGYETIQISATSVAQMEGKDLELSVMLDVTGSMWNDMDALRAAGLDLIDIVMGASTRPRRMAVVPFSYAVNVGPDYFQAVTGLPVSETTRKCKKWKKRRGRKRCKKWKTQTITRSTCVVARKGTYKTSDAAPGPGAYFGSFDEEKKYANHSSARKASCEPRNSLVIPLTSNRAILRQAMRDLQAGGWTAGHVGTLWAWQMLSPDWAAVWPAESTPSAYDPSRVMKVAILMTDGQYNTWYGEGGTSNQQALDTCNAMKAKGITVYTIGFDMAGQTTAINLLKACASSPDHYFFPYNGAALRQVFRTIGAQIADGADGITLAR